MTQLLMFVAAAVAVAALLVGAAVMARRLAARALWILVAALLAGDIFGGIAMRALREFGKLPDSVAVPPPGPR